MKLQEKQALAQWEEFHRSLQSNVFIDTSLSAQELEALKNRLEADPIAWIEHMFPAYAKYPFADFQRAAIHRIINNGEWKSCPGREDSPRVLWRCSDGCT